MAWVCQTFGFLWQSSDGGSDAVWHTRARCAGFMPLSGQVVDAHPLHALGLDPLGRAWQMLAMSSGWKLPEASGLPMNLGLFRLCFKARKGITPTGPQIGLASSPVQTREPSAESTLWYRIQAVVR